MGQKTNPNILRLGINKSWDFKNIEKKPQEIAKYSFKSIEIEELIEKFFKDNGLMLLSSKIHYQKSGILHIFISYYPIPEYMFLKNKLNKTYSKLNYNKHINALTCPLKNNSSINIILNKLLNNLQSYTSNSVNVILTIHQTNKEAANNRKLQIFKENLIELRRFEDNKFFGKGLQTLFYCSQGTNTADLLAKFIANELSKTKRHNFLLKFVKKSLGLSKNYVPGAIKIKISGRFNKARRAKHKFIHIGKNIPIFSIKNNIYYSDRTAYTSNGTFGVKVWVHAKKNKNA